MRPGRESASGCTTEQLLCVPESSRCMECQAASIGCTNVRAKHKTASEKSRNPERIPGGQRSGEGPGSDLLPRD